jgi:peroxiredoxin
MIFPSSSRLRSSADGIRARLSAAWRLPVVTALVFVLIAVAAAPAAALAIGDAVPDFALLDQHGHQHQMSAQAAAPVVVLFTYTTGCPIVRQDLQAVQDMQNSDAKLRIFLLDSTPEDSTSAVTAELAELGIQLPVLMDPAQTAARALGVTRSAEAIVISSDDLKLRWRGPIDDRVGYGAVKATAEHTYLADAVHAVAAGIAPVPGPAAKGCALAYTDADRTYDYAADIAPIIAGHCLQCHRDGGIAPFALTDLTAVLRHRAMIAETVQTRRMPPWQPDPGIGRFTHDDALSIDEQRALLRWIGAGAPHGAVAAPASAAGMSGKITDIPATNADGAAVEWPLGKPDLIVDVPPQQIPATGVVPYRRCEVAVDIPADAWVGGYDLHPSDRRVMHHGFAFIVHPGETVDARKPQFTGLDGFFAKYVPGGPPDLLPAGTGILLPKGAHFAFQLHYTTCAVAVTDHPRLGLYYLHAPPAHALEIASARAMDFTIPPGAEDTEVHAGWTTKNPITVYALSPHMHLRGAWMTMAAHYPDGHVVPLLSVPRYNVYWQWLYTLATPLQVPAGTCIMVDGGFDNSRSNELNPDPTRQVRWGEQTWDEMFVGYIEYSDR